MTDMFKRKYNLVDFYWVKSTEFRQKENV